MSALPKASEPTLESVTATLQYAGHVEGRPRFDLPTPSRMNIAFEPHAVPVHDARPVRDTFSVDTNGFAFVRHHSSVATSEELRSLNRVHQRQRGDGVNRTYHDEIAEYLKALTGAREVIAQTSGLIVRTSDRAKTRSWAGPAGFVHLDFTAKSSNDHLRWTLDEEQVTLKPYRRFAVFQTWRAISPGPQDNTLAMCDGRSVPPEDAVVLDSVIGPEDQPGCFFESRMCKYRPDHRWYYLPNMEPDDLILFKGFDSDVPEAMNAMHTAFENPAAGPNAVPRESLEARFFAIFD